MDIAFKNIMTGGMVTRAAITMIFWPQAFVVMAAPVTTAPGFGTSAFSY